MTVWLNGVFVYKLSDCEFESPLQLRKLQIVRLIWANSSLAFRPRQSVESNQLLWFPFSKKEYEKYGVKRFRYLCRLFMTFCTSNTCASKCVLLTAEITTREIFFYPFCSKIMTERPSYNNVFNFCMLWNLFTVKI